ncbi:MAG TPA: hypothetical protein PLW10_15905, partial [Myxococcota bacterium]|nr:hypothetical protein [Myxococcota bacterium]
QARPQHVDICMQARNQLKIRSRSALESLERGFPLTEAQERLIGAAGRDWPNMAPCNWRSRDW